MPIICKSEIEDYEKALKKYGFSENDFLLSEEDLTDYSINPNYLIGNAIVKNVITGKEGKYSAGHSTAWVVDFEKDLKKGFYQ